jgi:serine/threonine protein kinase
MRALAADDPRVVGEYRLRGRLGEGGMGRVYLGLSPAGRAVAIKVVRPELASDTEFLRRFQQEVASARAVSGIYTAPVVATGLNDHPPWLATAYVPGPSLAQVVREHGPLPESALRPLLAGLVEALQAIHACGVVHRDLKPPNVLLAADGPRVIDFGISRAAEGSGVTAAGAVFGTPSYMSPEQAEGKPGDRASDVFSLGCVIAFAATGAPPFGEGTAASVLYRVVHTEAALDGLPPWLRELVARCLAKDPAARPKLQALAAAIAGLAQDTGPFAVSFWPKSVTNLISAYQPRLEARASEEAPPDDGASTTYGVSAATASPHSYPGTQGHPGSRGYPDPQDGPSSRGGRDGYADVQETPSPAAGAEPPDVRTGGAGYPQPSQAAREARPRRPLAPDSVLNAVKLMYAAAGYAVIYAICAVLIIDGAVNPFASVTFSSEVVVAAISCVIQVTVWLWLARSCRKGKNWARIISTVFFGLYTVVALVVFIKYRHYAAGIIGTVLIAVIWLIAGGSVLLLWQRRSGAFFRASRQAGR